MRAIHEVSKGINEKGESILEVMHGVFAEDEGFKLLCRCRSRARRLAAPASLPPNDSRRGARPVANDHILLRPSCSSCPIAYSRSTRESAGCRRVQERTALDAPPPEISGTRSGASAFNNCAGSALVKA